MTNRQDTPVAERATIEGILREFMAKALPTIPTEDDYHVPFLEMGANSLVLMEVQRAVETRFGLTLTIAQFFQEITTIDALVQYIVDHQVKPHAVATPALTIAPSLPLQPTVARSELEAILAHQIDSAARAINQVVAQQLQFLGEMGLGMPQPTLEPPPAVMHPSLAVPSPSSSVIAHRMLSPLEIRTRGLSAQQTQHLDALIQRYTTRTRRSKELTARFRPVLADSRAAVGFRFTTKEMLYPITGQRAQGARIWDIDGNEYVDITMGQGVTMFGHRPDFIAAALADPANDSLLLGPRPPQAGEAAEILCELTGMERVTFTNTGTEAVMAALRLARAATKRHKIVMFDNAYHGHSDNVMGRPVWQDGRLSSVPVAPGITQGAVDDLWLLEYGADTALEFIRAHVQELAAVVVEPVQSRRPELQPRQFLHELRRITTDGGCLLIFDEMITGFRIHQGGAQAWFGVKADIATYGKVLAGGLPIGIVAGRAAIMDAIDGGIWHFGDASYPLVERTIFGGTFCQHPAAMITTLATLRHLKTAGPALQEALNQRTDRLAAELNDYFDAEDVPIRVVHFASLFRFAFSTNLELLFYHLMEQGVFIWEWRNYFLSTAHSDADVDFIIAAVKASVAEMRTGGFLPVQTVVDANVALESYPLTTAQQQLAVLAAITPAGSLAYHVSPLLSLRGSLQPAALRVAVRALMQRHTALRTVITGAQQHVMPLAHFPDAGLTYIDLSTDPQPEHSFALAQAEHAHRPFDLTRGPLFAALLFRLAPDDYRLILKAHHIVVDGLSMNILVNDLAALYDAAMHGVTATLPTPLPLRAYGAWLAQATFTQQREYWLQQLAGDLPMLDLPYDYPEPPTRSFRGSRYTIAIPHQLVDGVRELSRAQGCTLFMTLFAAYAVWLHRLCDQDEIVIGMPVAGRNMPGSDQLVAYSTHLIAIRSLMDGRQTVTAFLRATRDLLLAGYQHQDYPFAELINQPVFKTRRSNLVAALFNLDRPGAAPALAGVQVAWLSQPIQYTAFALTFNLTEVADALVLECDFNQDRFAATSIARYVGHFLTLVTGMVADPQQTTAQLPLLDAATRQMVLHDWNATQAAYPRDKCVQQLFEAQVQATPEANAVQFGTQTLTYDALNTAANRLAHWLSTQGVGPEIVVGLCLERSIELVVALLAILKAGGAYLPLDPAYPASRLEFMLTDAGVTLLLSQQFVLTRLRLPPGIMTLALDSQREVYAAATSTNPACVVNPSHLAYLIYTSGSTGKPKGTLIEHRNLLNYLVWAQHRYNMTQGDGAPLHASISFDATITSLFLPLITGRTLVVLPEGGLEIDHIRAALVSGRDWSLVKLTPAHLELLNAMITTTDRAGRVRYLVLGGEALLERHLAPWREYAPHTWLINEYGPTETVVGCCIYAANGATVLPGDGPTGVVPIGRPIANTQLYVLDRNLQPVPVGVKGELFIAGDGVARGYHQRPELTNERFLAIEQTGLEAAGLMLAGGRRLYRTGDVVRYLADGNLVYLGRSDSQIKIRGFRVELGEIEAILAQQPGVREAVVVAMRRTEQDVRLAAYIVAAADNILDERALRQALAELLPAHMIPGTLQILAAMPLTSNGKIDRAALPQPDGSRDAHATVYVGPGNEVERRIATIWQELLEVERVGVDDNFFELGGHSLLVLPLRDRLQALCARPITPVDILRLPTVAAQARFLTAAAGDDTQVSPEVVARQAAQRQREALRNLKDRRQSQHAK